MAVLSALLSPAGRSKTIAAVPIVLALGFMAFSHRERGETLHDIGFRSDNFLACCRLLLMPTVAAVVIIVVTGSFMNHAPFPGQFRARYIALPLWALLQQYALNGFINRRAQAALGTGLRSVALVAIVFALLHLP